MHYPLSQQACGSQDGSRTVANNEESECPRVVATDSDRHNEKERQRARRRKYRVLSRYSGGGDLVCACCGERHPKFLGIDHIDGGGREHRLMLGNGKSVGNQFYAYLARENFPPGYRVLCHNCNLSLGFFGYCPHTSPEKAASTLALMQAPGWAESL